MDVGENEEVRDHRRSCCRSWCIECIVEVVGYLVSGTRTSIGDFLTKNWICWWCAKVQEDDWQKAYKLRTLGPFKQPLQSILETRHLNHSSSKKINIRWPDSNSFVLYLPSNFRWKNMPMFTQEDHWYGCYATVTILCGAENHWAAGHPTTDWLPPLEDPCTEVPNGSAASVQEAHAIPDECCMLRWNNPRKMGQTLPYYDHQWSLISRFVTQTVSKSVREARIGRFCASRAIGMIIRSMEHVSTSTSITIWQTTPWNSTRSVTVVSSHPRHDLWKHQTRLEKHQLIWAAFLSIVTKCEVTPKSKCSRWESQSYFRKSRLVKCDTLWRRHIAGILVDIQLLQLGPCWSCHHFLKFPQLHFEGGDQWRL